MKQLLIGTLICVFVFAACDIAASGTFPIDDISGSNNDDPNINPTIDPPTIDPPTIDPPVDPWSFPVVTELWEPGEYTDDEGTSVTAAYPIDNWRQLQFIGETFLEDDTLLTHTYYLTDDITFPSRDDVPSEYINDYYVVNGFTPIGITSGRFLGDFDGQGYTISDISIIQNVNDSNDKYIGLFGYIGNYPSYDSGIIPMIQNLTLRNAQITGGTHTGTLVGYATYSVIKGVTVEGGAVQGENTVGGLVGTNSNSIISHSGASASVSGNTYVGGLIGYVYQSNSTRAKVMSNYATGDVTGTSTDIGGLIGSVYNVSKENGIIIENNYSLGTVSSTNKQVGGLIGSVGRINDTLQKSTITTNYSRSEVTGSVDVGGLIGYTYMYIQNSKLPDTDSSTLTNNFWDLSANSGNPPSGIYPSYGVGNPATNINATSLTPTTADDFTGFVFSTTEGWNTPADGAWPTLYWQE